MASRRHRGDDPELHGVLLLDKPAGPTSHDVVGWVRWVLGVRRVGHCGTLDPAATGLLVVGVGAATKLTPYLTGQDKGYRACVELGARTSTADAQGQVLEARPCPPDTEARVPEALARLRGEHRLPPPAYSAIHVDGRRAHELAREGEAPTLEPRPMTVYTLEPGPVIRRGDRVQVEATLLVSKGTYIRSLAEALGRDLDLPAHLRALHRTRSGHLGLDHPRAVTGLLAEREADRPDGAEHPPRWRVRLADPAAGSRQAAAAVLRAHLLTPAEAVPLPLLHASEGPSGQRALARLAEGQALSLPDPGLVLTTAAERLPTPAAGPLAPRLAVAPRGGPGLVIVRLEPDPGGGPDRGRARLLPERVVVIPAPVPLTEP